jgi:hypothetical protein
VPPRPYPCHTYLQAYGGSAHHFVRDGEKYQRWEPLQAVRSFMLRVYPAWNFGQPSNVWPANHPPALESGSAGHSHPTPVANAFLLC